METAGGHGAEAGKSAPLILPFAAVDRGHLPQVGGKAANLGEMLRAGFPVPGGFCVTVDAFRAFMSPPALEERFAALGRLAADDIEAVREAGERMRSHLLALPIPPAVEAAVVEAWRELGEEHAYAVRSSATAEDLPGASFAGQHDTYLNVIGREALLGRVRSCWASLFTDRAIAYRARNGFDHREVLLAVVVQRMVRSSVSGILFTADPVDGRRHVVSIDAGFGLGEALVSGIVNPDLYKIDKRTNTIIEKTVADKQTAIVARAEGGAEQVALHGEKRRAQALADAEILELAELGCRVEAHYGTPQDIEWCVEDGVFFLVQSRPITTLYPLPVPVAGDTGLRVYLSFGHFQVMTDVMAPFAHGMWRRFFPVLRGPDGESRLLRSAGGRLFLDPSDVLRRGPPAKFIPKAMLEIDRQSALALADVIARPAFRETRTHISLGVVLTVVRVIAFSVVPCVLWRLFFADPARIEPAIRRWMEARLADARARVDAAATPVERLRTAVDILSGAGAGLILNIVPTVVASIFAGKLARRLVAGRVGTQDLDALDRGLRGNVTTEMTLRIGDLADIARATPAVAELLRQQPDAGLESLSALPDATAFLEAIADFLETYGMRGASEIDITRPRWRDDPRPVLQAIRGNLSQPDSGAHRGHHESLRREGEAAAARVAAAAPWGRRLLVRRLVRYARAVFALREHPKFCIVSYFGLIREAALAVGGELAARQVIEQPEDVWMLGYAELLAAADGEPGDVRALVEERRAEMARDARLRPPRVMTSEGEVVTAKLSGENLPEGALVGAGVSAGVVEGVARVVRDPSTAVLRAGEILVAPFTDPGWTPLFINAAGLVMEVGGMMTHGSVVAREYGIPAVVCVDGATSRIATGQRLRVDGDGGYVLILEPGKREPDPSGGTG